MIYSTTPTADPTNVPSLVTLKYSLSTNEVQYVQLPTDAIITFDDEKAIAESKILDGVEVFERISRKAFGVNFDFTIRQKKSVEVGFVMMTKYVFPQDTIEELHNLIWLQDRVIEIENTLLNTIGINKLIVMSVSYTTIRGNTDVLCSMKCKECVDLTDAQGTSLILD